MSQFDFVPLQTSMTPALPSKPAVPPPIKHRPDASGRVPEEMNRVLDNSSTPIMRFTEVVFCLAAIGLFITHVVIFSMTENFWAWPLVFAILLGALLADFMSGVIHWAGDTWGKVTTPWIGPRLLVPFRYHHLYPRDMLTSDVWRTNGDNAAVACLFMLVAFIFPYDVLWGKFAAVTLVSLGFWGAPTSQYHKWSHTTNPPRLVRWAQRCRLILTPQAHWQHHKVPFDRNYCITTGWCNPFLTRIRFFPAVEWVISKTTGSKPRDDEYANGLPKKPGTIDDGTGEVIAR